MTARTLAVLAQTFAAVRRLRLLAEPAPAKPDEEGRPPDDELPEDIDEFRHELARRIDAFVASRMESNDVPASPSERV